VDYIESVFLSLLADFRRNEKWANKKNRILSG
jgi:hypothetical protein